MSCIHGLDSNVFNYLLSHITQSESYSHWAMLSDQICIDIVNSERFYCTVLAGMRFFVFQIQQCYKSTRLQMFWAKIHAQSCHTSIVGFVVFRLAITKIYLKYIVLRCQCHCDPYAWASNTWMHGAYHMPQISGTSILPKAKLLDPSHRRYRPQVSSSVINNETNEAVV